LNYVEGQTSIGNETLDSKAIGSVQLEPGQSLDTRNGKAEILLTPGVFLRVGSNSSVKMVSPELTNTQVSLDRGEAMLEVDEIHPQNDLRVRQPGATTRVLKTGLYNFDATDNQVRVFDGKAKVQAGDREVSLKGGRELALNATGEVKAQKFDKKDLMQTDELYRWSSLRSDYLSEANVETARIYVADGWWGPGWFGAGWYWNPWFGGFTFIPAGGYLYNPFGWPFYSPWVVPRGPVIIGHVPHRFDTGRRAVPSLGSGFHDHAVRSFGGRPPMGFRGNPGMHAPSSGFHGGGFSGRR
jgi:FecR-like protein